ncbi:MAG: Trk system potassium transporter TrkA [Oscillospiraceae bacterium]|nr:Trk system potassium transporter TrkA [Oscillospiraceae bacterium]MCD8191289.1 Trk system potassium transporter TrkA [Oscillospiraceae bacterium]
MKIVIIGGGKVGSTIANQLTREGHDITIIEQSSSISESLSDSLDIMSMCGNGGSLDVMRAAGVGDNELIIACTAKDELNLLCCMTAKRLGCPNAIARVRNPEYSELVYFLRDELNLSMSINPELTAAREIFRQLEIPGVLRRESFAKGRVEIVEIVLKSGDLLDGCALADVHKKLKRRVLVCAVQRGDEVFIPDGSFVLLAGDKIHICAPATELVGILRSLNLSRRKAKNVIIIGASRIAKYLTSMLLKTGSRVKVVEINPAKAEEFAEQFPEAETICGDGSGENLLRSENAEQMDAVIALTNIDEQNLVLGMYMTSLGVKQVITKVDHIEFSGIFEDKGIDRVISPKKLSANEVVRYVRAMQNSEGSSVVALHHFVDGKVEALEFNVIDETRHRGEMLMNVRLRPDILIGSINRMGHIIIPGGRDTLEAGDIVVVVSHSRRVILDLNDIFAEEE